MKWQFVGPVTFGLALMRAGVPMSEAFSSAVRAIRTRVQHLLEAVEVALPQCRQIVFIKEPVFGELMQPGFPIAPETAIDLVSGALAAIETTAMSGLHCCGSGDIPSQLAAGPAILSLPVKPEIADSAGYLIRFLEAGGYIAWCCTHDGSDRNLGRATVASVVRTLVRVGATRCRPCATAQSGAGDSRVWTVRAHTCRGTSCACDRRRDRSSRSRSIDGDALGARRLTVFYTRWL